LTHQGPSRVSPADDNASPLLIAIPELIATSREIGERHRARQVLDAAAAPILVCRDFKLIAGVAGAMLPDPKTRKHASNCASAVPPSTVRRTILAR
jgi:hypothetical protein